MERSSLDEFITEVEAMPVTLPAIQEILGRLGDTAAAAAADRAEGSGEAGAAVRIFLAGLLRGEAPAAGRVARLLPFVADIRVALLLMNRAEGDRVTEILEVCKSGRLSEEREAAMLFLATEILGSEPAPEIRTTRLGQAHRLLFRIDPDAGHLEALEAIHRKDLDAALRRYRP